MVGPALALLLAFTSVASPARQDDAAALRAQVKGILERGHYQQSMPGRDEPTPPEFHLRGSGIPISPELVLVICGGLLVLAIALGLSRHDFLASTAKMGVAPAAEAGSLLFGRELPLADLDADALAAAGRFADAIHVLLLRALREMARAGIEFGRGLTSREVLLRVADPAAREPLRELVATVERHEFAARELTAADFERCRSASTRLRVPAHADVQSLSHD